MALERRFSGVQGDVGMDLGGGESLVSSAMMTRGVCWFLFRGREGR